jgi:ATP adenylyltransferase
MRGTATGTQAIHAVGGGRFQNLLRGMGGDHDQVLLETCGCIVAPTLGSIIPNWLLVVPRHAAVSFREWHTNSHVDPVRLIDNALSTLGVEPARAIWFEHGPSGEGSTLGCGVDYAHLHILVDAPFSFNNFSAAITESARINWRWTSPTEAYACIRVTGSYLVAGSHYEAILAEGVESVGSQFFRRVIALLVGKPDQWDYKTHAHLGNVWRTISAFGNQGALTEAP